MKTTKQIHTGRLPKQIESHRAWMFACCECRVLSGRGLCDELINHPEESYRLWRVVVCDLGILVNEEALAHWWLLRQKQTNKQTHLFFGYLICSVGAHLCRQLFT